MKESRFEAREADWRNGCTVYQVLVDRFAPARHLEAKRQLYAAPRKLRAWGEDPKRGQYLSEHRLWSHEVDFWGGDLASLMDRLDHIQQLGADVLYLNPICDAFTNHKYDASDYTGVSAEYGTRGDVKRLADELHRRGMKLVLDGVFNHMGRNSPLFQQAVANPQSEYRSWFDIDEQNYKQGHRSWWGAPNLPELQLENPAVREYLWGAPDSVVRGWLRDGADGWRLDVAYDIGYQYLAELTAAAHEEKPGSLVVGEIPNHPSRWLQSVDSVMMFNVRRLLIALANGELDGATVGRMVTRLVEDAGIEAMLKCWVYLDNHDTARIATTVPDERRRRIAQTLQFMLPGAVQLYYGSEVGQEGDADPEMRGPMRWDRVAAEHPQLAWTRQLCALRRQHRALRIGDYIPLETRQLYGFQRSTDKALESLYVVVNPNTSPVREWLLLPDPSLMDGTQLQDLFGQVPPLVTNTGMALLEVPPLSVVALQPQDPLRTRRDGYTNFKRVP